MKFLAAIAAALVLSQAVAAQNGTWSAPWVAGSISTTPAPSATRTAFSVTPYPATTPAAYVTGFVVYGAGKWVTFVPTNNCSVSGTAQVGNPTCAPQVVSSGNYTVTSVEAINATHVIAVAGPGLWLFNGNTLVGSWNVTGGVLDFFTNWYYTTSSQQPDHASLLMLNNMLYIGTSNWTAGGKGAIIKFNLWTWSAEWWSWTTQAYANYPLSWGVINSTDVIAFRSSATSGTSTTDIGVVTAATGAMWPVQSFSASYYIRGYAPQIVNELVVLVGYNFYTVTITPTGASYQTNSVDTVQYASNIVPLTNGGLVVTSDTSAYVFNVSTGTSVRVASYSGSHYIHQVLIVNGTSGVLFGTSWGIYAWNLNNQATWKWFALPSYSGSGNQWSYGCEALWWGSAPGVILASFNQYVSGTGGVFALNATSGQQLWRFSDNFDVVGAAVAVPAPNYAGVWSYYGALRNTGPYGTRSAVGWATNGTGWTNIPSSNPTAPTQDGSSYYTTIYCPMTDLVISATPNYFWASNSDGSTNFSTYISIGSAYPYSGIATFPTMACVGGSSYLYCYKFGATSVTSVSVSFTIQYIQASGTTLYVYGGTNVYTVDTTATSLSTTQVTRSTDNTIGYPLAGFQTTIATVKLAVLPYSSSVDVVADNKAVSAIGGFGSSTNSFYSNAALVDGSAWVGGYGTVLGTAGYFLARVALPTPALTRYTTPKLGKIVYVTGAGSNAIIAYGDNLTAWSTGGTLYWSANPPAGTQFFAPFGTSLINTLGVPTVDTVRGVVTAWVVNASSTSSRVGFAVYNLYTGALLQVLGITPTTAYPKGQPIFFQGVWLIGSKTHACGYAITNDVDYTNTNTARWCTTIDGYNTIGGFGVKGNWVFLGQSGETIAFTAPNITGLQNWNFAQTGSFAAPSLLEELKANLALIVGVVAVVVVILIVVGIIVKVKSGGAARPGDKPDYQEFPATKSTNGV